MKNNLVVKSTKKTTTIPRLEPKLGQWYWVTEVCKWNGQRDGMKKGDVWEWFGCVMKIGSNFVELHSPHSNKIGYTTERIHIDEFETRLRLEEDPKTIISNKILHWQTQVQMLLKEVKNLTLRLGLNPKLFIDNSNQKESSTSLVVISGKENIEEYKKELILAKEKTLPDLFDSIKNANEEMCRWMLADTMEIKASITPMEKSIDEINNRIFTVSLYAGLTEQVVKISDGEPAKIIDKLHVMQRKLYMDEECLLNYNAGGMEFSDIHEFDSWVAKPENRNRILPFPRTLVAMQVRRKTKERDYEENLLQAFININISFSDSFTFLYIRNGEQLYRLSCDMEFGQMIFPDRKIFDPSEPKMVKTFCGRVDEMISVSHYEVLLQEYNDNKLKSKQWEKENPIEHPFTNPYRHKFFNFNPRDWSPFDPTNLYFDECMETISSKIREYNRIALIIQGLFDRSLIFHPHLPIRTWIAEEFEKSIKLVYDGEMTIYGGETPDFEEYRNKLNKKISSNSIVTGQEQYWMEREAEKENKRREKDYRNRSSYRFTVFRPYDDPGPGRVAKIFSWKKKPQKAIFKWKKEKIRNSWRGSGLTTKSITVPVSRLLNISEYKQGDYLQFFNDPRTREQYLKWAPLLLTAEDYLAGEIKILKEG